jgi:endonuclease/exonuclease/phosphatase family metal-dependent hydrolase
MSRCLCLVRLVLMAVVAGVLSPAHAQDLNIATWNIQTLTTGKKVFPNQNVVCDQADLGALASFATGIVADVIALQEIASPAAAAQVFPISDWTICISGQFFEAYPSLGHAAQADCFNAAPLPDTPASEELARQFTAVVVRRSAGLTVNVSDVPQLGVLHRDDKDGTDRAVRWGLVASVKKGNQTFTLLDVHLKSACFFERVSIPIQPPPSTRDCDTFARQVPVLDNFVRSAPKPFVVLGDFNRNLDLDGEQVFARLKGDDTPGIPDSTKLHRFPSRSPSLCFPEPASEYHYVPIDYFLISDGLRGSNFREMVPMIPPGIAAGTFKKRFSDHCPKSLKVEVQN